MTPVPSQVRYQSLHGITKIQVKPVELDDTNEIGNNKEDREHKS